MADPRARAQLGRFQFKGHSVVTLAANLILVEGDPPFQKLDPGGASRTVTLPAVTSSKGKFFWIENTADAAENLTVQDAVPNTIKVLNQNEGGLFVCDGATWQGMVMAAGTGASLFLPLAGGTMDEAANITLGTTTGSKIGTAVGEKLGFHGAAPVVQASGATQVALAAYATGAFGLDSDANMQALYDLVVAIRAALVAKGIMKGAA